MRISVELVLSLSSQGATPEAILDDYPELEPEDIRACTAHAHAVIASDSLLSSSSYETGYYLSSSDEKLRTWVGVNLER